ncbi:MAG: hypothetical protein ABSA67_06850 [Candidatus Brocadiia bacterium]|jgi:hypothetical protein
MREIPRNAGCSRIVFTIFLAGLIILLAGGGAFAQVSWPIYASSGGNGSISPAGTVYFPDGAGASFTFIPDPGFMVYQVFVDGNLVAANTPGFTLGAIHGQHSVVVTFMPVSDVPYYGGGVVVTGPDLYLFGGGYDRGRDVRDYSHRGAESRAEAHPAPHGGEGGGHEGGGHEGKR